MARRVLGPVLWILLALSASVGRAQTAADPEPDYSLAYALATASYCAYAVGQKDADQGHDRGVKCLSLAAKADSRLNGLDVGPNNVEAYFVPAKPVDAYLLINAKISIFLAFRGTLTPPLSLDAGGLGGAIKHAASSDRNKEFCRRFVDTHFAVFSSVQKLVWVKDKRPRRRGAIFSRRAFMKPRTRSCGAIRNGAAC